MTEAEAIKELQYHIDSPFGIMVSEKTCKLAINALEKQIKLREKIEYIRQYCDTSDRNIKKQLSLLREFLIAEVADEKSI